MNEQKGLILLSHGSVICGAALELFDHADRLRRAAEFVRVEVGFLNYSKPTLADALSACIAAGAREIVIVPYFLVPGHFARKIVQDALAAQRSRDERIAVRIGEPIGYDNRISSAILNLSDAAAGPELWSSLAKRAMAACIEDSTCPLYGNLGCKAENIGNEVK